MIPFVDLKTQYLSIKDEVNAAIQGVLESCQFTLGSEVAKFEEEFAAYSGAKIGIGVNTGTSALHLALLAANIGPGDEVITVPFTFVASVAAIHYTGAKPVFVDIDLATFNVDPKSFEKAITPKTKAVIAVHLFGRCASLPEKKNILLIEDCAQSLGAEQEGRRCGSWGAFGCFSFYPTKNLGAVGDAGLITTNDDGYAETLRMLRHHGSRKTYLHERVGWNSRLDELQAAVLRVKLGHLERFNAARQRVADSYRRELKGTKIVLPAEPAGGKHAWHQFTIRSERRDAIREALAAQGIASSIFYPMPLHKQPAYAAANAGVSLAASEEAARTVLSLPIHPLLDDAGVARIAGIVKGAA